MWRKIRWGSLALALGAMAGVGGTKAEPANVSAFSGADFSPHSQYYYLGAVFPLMEDSSRSQFVLRTYGSFNRYDYISDPSLGTEINVHEWQADVMLGYTYDLKDAAIAVYVGVDRQKHTSSPFDPSSQTLGSETGFKVAGEFETSSELPYYVNLDGEYSTAFDSYWSRLRLGCNVGPVTVGPEGSVEGTTGYDVQRLGAFGRIDLNAAANVPASLTVSAGHQFVRGSDGGADNSGGGGEGTYGAVTVGMSF